MQSMLVWESMQTAGNNITLYPDLILKMQHFYHETTILLNFVKVIAEGLFPPDVFSWDFTFNQPT